MIISSYERIKVIKTFHNIKRIYLKISLSSVCWRCQSCATLRSGRKAAGIQPPPARPHSRPARLSYPSAARAVTRPRCTCESLPCGGPAETAAPGSAGRGFALAKLPCRAASWRAGRGAAELAFPYFVENSLIH